MIGKSYEIKPTDTDKNHRKKLRKNQQKEREKKKR